MDGLKYTVSYAIIDVDDKAENQVFAKLKDWKKDEVIVVKEMIEKE